METKKKPDYLTEKQERFCQEYHLEPNGTKAAIRATYSKKTAAQTASRLLKNVKIIARLIELRQELLDKWEISEERIMQELCISGFLDPGLFFTKTGQYTHIKKLEDLPPQVTRAITGINIHHGLMGSTFSYKFGGKQKSLELMMRRLGMLNDKLILDNRLDIFKHADRDRLKEKYDQLRNGKKPKKGNRRG